MSERQALRTILTAELAAWPTDLLPIVADYVRAGRHELIPSKQPIDKAILAGDRFVDRRLVSAYTVVDGLTRWLLQVDCPTDGSAFQARIGVIKADAGFDGNKDFVLTLDGRVFTTTAFMFLRLIISFGIYLTDRRICLGWSSIRPIGR